VNVSLPDLIEIVPLTRPAPARITVPGSKSITNRALILAALAEGEIALEGALWSEDTQVMGEALERLGFRLTVAADQNESCNRLITVQGKGGVVPAGGAGAQPLDLFVGNAGTAARFLAAFVCLGEGRYRLHGIERMHQRPQAALFTALRQLGYQIDAPNDRLPAVVHGAGRRPGKCRVNVEESSQFASALMLCARAGDWEVEVVGADPEESAYVAMTRKLIGAFPVSSGRFAIEPDASSGSYFVAADRLVTMERALVLQRPSDQGSAGASIPHRMIAVEDWPDSDWQIDARFSRVVLGGADLSPSPSGDRTILQAEACAPSRGTLSRRTDLGDSILTAMVLAPFADRPIHFTDLEKLRLQECERVAAMRTNLSNCGVQVSEHENTLTIFPSAGTIHGAEIETCNDHRIAMCFAVLGLKVPGIKLRNPACVKKTFPDFFQKLVGEPPGGLGATIRDAVTGRDLGIEDLFAG